MPGVWNWSTMYSCKGLDSKPRKGYQIWGIAVGITVRFITADFHQKFSFRGKYTLSSLSLCLCRLFCLLFKIFVFQLQFTLNILYWFQVYCIVIRQSHTL